VLDTRSPAREKIIAAALAILARRGTAFTMRDLGRKLGYSAASIYVYFRNKEELLREIALHGFAKLTEATRAATEIADLHGAVLESGRCYLDFALRHPALYRLMFEDLAIGDLRTDGEAMPGRELFDQYRDMYARAAARGAIGDVDPEIQTVIGWSAVHGFAMLAITDRIPPPRLEGRAIEELRDAFLRFMGASLKL